jgi:hypothetical protein
MTYPYAQAVDPVSVQMDPKKLENVIDLFKKQQSSGAFPGGQMVGGIRKVVLGMGACFHL